MSSGMPYDWLNALNDLVIGRRCISLGSSQDMNGKLSESNAF